MTLFSLLVLPLVSSALADDGTGNETCETDLETIPECPLDADVLLPDLMTVVPKHLQIQNSQQNEMLRFSNGIANVGLGPWWLEPEFPAADASVSCQGAWQLIAGPEHFPDRSLLADGTTIPAPEDTYRHRCQKGSFDFHETHNHWHVDNIGEFKVCAAADFEADGSNCDPATTTSGSPTTGVKYTFCLIDWYKLADNTASSDDTRNFFDCASGMQGITPGWVDQYHQATDGQEINITGIPAGSYVLVSSVNGGALAGDPLYEESDTTNNTSYMRFDLKRDSKGNAQIRNESGACDDKAFVEALEVTIGTFAAQWENGSARFTEDMVEDMCGGKPANR